MDSLSLIFVPLESICGYVVISCVQDKGGAEPSFLGSQAMHFALILYKVTPEINNGTALDEFYRLKFSHARFPFKEATGRFKEPPT